MLSVNCVSFANIFFSQIEMCCRHDFYNSATEVVLTIFAKGVPADCVVVDFGEQMVCPAIVLL
jgi:hypothetical protein